MKRTGSRLLWLGIALAVFWFVGGRRPIVDQESRTGLEETITCPRCKGVGSVQKEVPCPKCKGTGKGEWFFDSLTPDSLKDSSPICMNCRGKKRTVEAVECPHCQGKGEVGATILTPHEGNSVWERTLASIGVHPEPNAKPQQHLFTRRVPLVIEYIERYATKLAFKTTDWSKVTKMGDRWMVTVRIDMENPRGGTVSQYRRFFVKNREVVKTERADIIGGS
jgi:hypothetical protein